MNQTTTEEKKPPHIITMLPDSVADKFQMDGGHPENLVIAQTSDLSREATFGNQWVLIDDHHVRVMSVNDQDHKENVRIPLKEIQNARIEQCVGNALLEVTLQGKPRILLHFSNELTENFALVANYLHSFNEGKNPPPVPDPNSEGKRCISCGRKLLDPSLKVCPTCIKRGQVMRRMLFLARPFWKQGGIHIVLMLLGIGVDLLPPYLTRILIDDVLTVQNHVGWLIWLVAGLLGLQVVRVLVTIQDNLLINRISSQFAASVREKMFGLLKTLSLDFFDRNESGRLMTRINQDTEELQGLINQLASFALNALLVIGIGLVLFSMAPSLGLFVLIPAPFVIAASIAYQRYMYPHFRRYWTTRWRLNAMLSTFLSGIQVVKAFAQEDQEQERYNERNQTTLAARLRVDLAWSRFFPLISFAFGAGGLIIWYAGGKAVLAHSISLGTLMAFLSYLGMFYGPLSNMAQISQAFNRFVTISQRTFEFLDEVPKVKEAEMPTKHHGVQGRIVFDHVSFGYDPYFPVLKDVSLEITPGEMIGIVGASGAGKTTLVNLISRFYDPTQGRVSIDGIDLHDYSKDELRRNIGIVLQSPFLFSGTLAQNIAYARPEASRDDVIRAAKAANAHEFISNFPEGYDTIVGEGGTGLSGGERQRVSIARAILLNPRILILDEATSSVDTETERQIQKALETLVKGRTTIAVAHRLSTLYNADRIIGLDRGRVVESGSPEELIERKGLFYNLVQMQTKFAHLDGVATV